MKKIIYILTLFSLITIPLFTIEARSLSDTKYLKHHYPLNFDSYDTISGDDGTDTSIAYNGITHTGKTCAVFDGADSKIDTESDWIGTGMDSFACWIYPVGWGENNNGVILCNEKIKWRLKSSNQYMEFSSNGANLGITAVNSIVLNQWQYIVVTRNSAGDKTNLYINGVLSGTANQNSGAPAAGTTNVIIGNNDVGSRTFNGNISNIRHWETVLSADEVWQLYKEISPNYAVQSQPIGQLPVADSTLVSAWLNKATIGTGDDYTGIYDGTVNNIETWENIGARFNGENSNINVGDITELNSTSSFTISFWMNQDVIDVIDYIFFKYADASNNIVISTMNTGNFLINLDTAGAVEGYFDYSTVYSAGSWVYITIVYDGSNTGNTGRLKIYFDGVNQTLSFTGTVPTSNTNLAGKDALIGTTIFSFDGKLKDFRIYSDAKTADWIKTEFEKGVPDDDLRTWIINDKDLSRHNIPLALNNIENVGDKGYKFNGTDSQIDLGSNTISTGADSFCAWIYAEGWGEVNGRIVENSRVIFAISTTNDTLYFTSDGATWVTAATNAISLNKWIHVAVTRNSNGICNFYVNGKLSGTANQASGTPMNTGTTDVYIGNNGGTGATFDGWIKDFRHYEKELSANKIKTIYDDTKLFY